MYSVDLHPVVMQENKLLVTSNRIPSIFFYLADLAGFYAYRVWD